jgi:hypothetical protein
VAAFPRATPNDRSPEWHPGRYADFHSLRKSLGTALRRAGVDVAVSRQFLRHSDVRLTL